MVDKERNNAEEAFRRDFTSAIKNTVPDAYVEKDTGFIVIPADTVRRIRKEREERRRKKKEENNG